MWNTIPETATSDMSRNIVVADICFSPTFILLRESNYKFPTSANRRSFLMRSG